MTSPTTNPDDDQDFHKGAVEGDRASDEQPGNANAPALDENGMPADPVATAQDRIGANDDQSQG